LSLFGSEPHVKLVDKSPMMALERILVLPRRSFYAPSCRTKMSPDRIVTKPGVSFGWAGRDSRTRLRALRDHREHLVSVGVQPLEVRRLHRRETRQPSTSQQRRLPR
jgi:hypothetical protein